MRTSFIIALFVVSSSAFAAQVNEDVYSPLRIETEVEVYRHDAEAVVRGNAADQIFNSMKAPEQWSQGKYIKPPVTKTLGNVSCEKPMNGAEPVCVFKLSK